MYVVDGKGTNVLANSAVAYSEADAARAIRVGAKRITYVPHRGEMDRLAEIVNAHIESILSTGAAWCFVFHELGDLIVGGRFPPAIGELYRKGAALKHVALAAYQRTVDLPRLSVNQSNHVFLFALYDDRELVAAASVMGAAVRDDPLRLPFAYDFYYRDPTGQLVYVDQRRGTARLVKAGAGL